MARALSPKQQAFVALYATCGNATEAARQAGYSAGRARVIGSENLTKPAIQAALAELTDKVASDRIADANERQTFWTEVMRDKAELTKDRLKASELLGRANLDFIERHEMTGANGASLTPPDFSLTFVTVAALDDD